MPPRKITPANGANVERELWLITNAEVEGDWNRVWVKSPSEVVIYNSYEANMKAQLAPPPVKRRTTRVRKDK